MFRLEISTHFSAAHALLIQGWREPLHGHDWHVVVTVEGPKLDADGLLCDFHYVHAHLVEIVRPFQNTNLNDQEPFRSGVNPSAERVAWHIATVLSERLETRAHIEPKHHDGPAGGARVFAPAVGVRICGVRITEAVGCAAIYEPPTKSPLPT